MTNPGKLQIIGTPIGNLGDLSPRAVDALRDADLVAAEDTRRTRALCSHFGINKRMISVNEHNEARQAELLVGEVIKGMTIAYATDSGMPAISDPGHRLVSTFHAAGIQVEVIPGPSAITHAVAACGFECSRFVFEGFMPAKHAPERINEIAVRAEPSVLFEAPHRLVRTLKDLAEAGGADREIFVGRELTKLFEEHWFGTIGHAVKYWSDTEPRGEFTIITGPTQPAPSESADNVVLVALAQSTLSAKEASKIVASVTEMSANNAYAEITRIRPTMGDG